MDRDIKEYPVINKDVEINGLILSLYSKRGESFIILNDSVKKRLIYSENKEYNKSALCDFLHKGDSISKRVNSDSLFIYRDKRKFYFILGMDYPK